MKPNRVKQWLKNHRAIILKSLLIIAIYACIAVITYLILRVTGFASVEGFKRIRTELGDSIYTYLIISALQIIQVICIPVSNQLVTLPVTFIFNDRLLYVWLTSWLSIWIATVILYFLGRWGGQKILNWLLRDTEQVDKCTNFLKKGWIFYPIGMLLPLPDDIITILAGTGKMNFVFVLIASLFTRAIDTAISVFGFGILTRYWWGWLILAIGVILLILATILFWKIQKRKEVAKND